MDTDIGTQIKSGLKWLRRATVVLYLAVIGVTGYGYVTLQNVVADNKQALCAFRDNIERAAEDSEEFLRENPDGIPGLTPKVIQAGIDRQGDALKALSGLDCS
jgi:hypothetical protein